MIEIRPATSWADCLQCEALQRRIWQTADGSDVVPASLLITALKNGGLLLGAYEGQEMQGFVFGFLGAEGEGERRIIKHCSHMLAVLPEFRNLGLGLNLKKKQRDYLMSKGIDLVTWTYDPMQLANAKLNIKRLGAIARRYIRDAYGKMVDVINSGISSDRFEAEWWLSGSRVRAALDGSRSNTSDTLEQAQFAFRVRFDDRSLPVVEEVQDLTSDVCLIDIPADLGRLKLQDLGLARAWRDWTRSSFEAAFRSGYAAVDIETWEAPGGGKRAAYVLMKNISSDLAQINLTYARRRI